MGKKLFFLVCASLLAFQIVTIISIILFNYSHKSPPVKDREALEMKEIKQENEPPLKSSSPEILEKKKPPVAPLVETVEIPTNPTCDQKKTYYDPELWDPSDLPEELSTETSIYQPSWEESDLAEAPILAPVRAELRYTTPKGIGYNSGYTSLSGFFAPQERVKENFIPFLDLRAHLFNNSRWAANGGIGLRYLNHNHVFGTNLYYDFRNASKIHNCNQIALGFEDLGRVFDVRLNGYLPLGHQKSSPSTALKAVNLEVGAHINHFRKTPLYCAVGPYYLNGGGKSSFGGEARLCIDLLKQIVRLEANSSYDLLFKWRGQAQASIYIPLNKKKCSVKEPSCHQSMNLHERALQDVERHEIIPIKR